jgi:arsenate reductase
MSKAKVLFLCTGNSCRSQMAEGFLQHLAGDRFEVFSAGSRPKGLSPDAAESMKEVGIDISGQRSKNVTEFLGQRMSYVITVCDRAKESCPIFPGAFHTIHWGIDDPALAQGSNAERMVEFRRVRDEIEEHIRNFIGQAS